MKKIKPVTAGAVGALAGAGVLGIAVFGTGRASGPAAQPTITVTAQPQPSGQHLTLRMTTPTCVRSAAVAKRIGADKSTPVTVVLDPWLIMTLVGTPVQGDTVTVKGPKRSLRISASGVWPCDPAARHGTIGIDSELIMLTDKDGLEFGDIGEPVEPIPMERFGTVEVTDGRSITVTYDWGRIEKPRSAVLARVPIRTTQN